MSWQRYLSQCLMVSGLILKVCLRVKLGGHTLGSTYVEFDILDMSDVKSKGTY